MMLGEIDLLSAFKIALECKKKNVNIIHAHSAHALSIGILIKVFYPSVFLIGVRRVDFPIHKNFFSRLKYNSKKVNKIICISEFIKGVLIDDDIKKEKLLTIRSGVEISRFNNIIPKPDFKESLGIKSGEFLVGTIAAFAGHKDYPNLLKAFELVLKQKNNVKLCMVGDGPLKGDMEQLAVKLGIDKNIIMTGFRSDVGNFLKSFDLFVLASKKEGLGTSIIDALSVGLPVIATNTGGIPELIKDGINGKLVEAKNHVQLANTIIQLIDDSSLRNSIGNRAKQSAAQFSIDSTIENNIKLYMKMIGGRTND